VQWLNRAINSLNSTNQQKDFKWEKRYEIGHSRIDFEHQIFVDLIQKIAHEVKLGTNKKYMERLLYEIRKYTEFHFISEENIMYSINYPEYETHKKLHEGLLETFSQQLMGIELNEQTIDTFLDFLGGWFVNHTLNEDKKIANFVKGKNI